MLCLEVLIGLMHWSYHRAWFPQDKSSLTGAGMLASSSLPSRCRAADSAVHLSTSDSDRIWANTKCIQIWTVDYSVEIWAVDCRDKRPVQSLCIALQRDVAHSSLTLILKGLAKWNEKVNKCSSSMRLRVFFFCSAMRLRVWIPQR